MMQQKRPIIIFPQGTRVNPDQNTSEKPYKVGIARIQEATDLPIIPLALNTGLFWPRSGWGKTPGKITFEFLKPIKPGLARSALVSHVEEIIEDKSNALMEEARNRHTKTKPKKHILPKLIATLCLLYAVLWIGASYIGSK